MFGCLGLRIYYLVLGLVQAFLITFRLVRYVLIGRCLQLWLNAHFAFLEKCSSGYIRAVVFAFYTMGSDNYRCFLKENLRDGLRERWRCIIVIF